MLDCITAAFNAILFNVIDTVTKEKKHA